jgi:hypothetical protein
MEPRILTIDARGFFCPTVFDPCRLRDCCFRMLTIYFRSNFGLIDYGKQVAVNLEP